MAGYREIEFEEGAEKYFKRFNAYFGTDIKPLPADWLNIGREGGGNSLKLSNDILRIAKNMDKKDSKDYLLGFKRVYKEF